MNKSKKSRMKDKKMTQQDVSLIHKESGYQGFFSINQYAIQHALFNGEKSRVIIRECLERGHAVGVLAYDPWQDKVILLEQFRIGAYVNISSGNNVVNSDTPWLLEIIAGMVEVGESQEDVAHREAIEEAGCTILDLEPIGDFYSSSGGCSETIQLYCGCVNSEGVEGIHGVEEEGEDIRVMVVSFETVVQWLKEGRLNNASTMISMQWLMLNYDRIRKQWLKD
ncbi:MAG: NUDIX domain-containing protein [gamma proteobacterium symbiont of Taylorina sp.]|nr:NUDIX domain-containing protein [gamma proteobacterium symbiont of Taylorina sp.]